MSSQLVESGECTILCPLYYLYYLYKLYLQYHVRSNKYHHDGKDSTLELFQYILETILDYVMCHRQAHFERAMGKATKRDFSRYFVHS